MSEVVVRRASLKDVAAMVRVANQAFLEQARWADEFGAGLVWHFREYPDWQFVAEVEGEVVGLLVGRVGEGKALISWIAVHPAHWGKGIGGRLLETIEEKAKKGGFSTVELGTPFAREFYEKYGYKCIGTRRRMVLDMAQRAIDRPEGLLLRPIRMEDLPDLLDFVREETEYLLLLEKFFEAIRREPEMALLAEREGRLEGAVVGKTAERVWELVIVSYLFAKSREEILFLLRGLAYLCSCQGRRWVGVELPFPYVSEADLEVLGFEEAKLPTFWTFFSMRKEL